MTSRIQICDADSIHEFEWPEESWRFREMLTALVTQPSREFVANCQTTFLLARVDGHVLPVTINDQQWENSYVCSPYSGAISYPLEELREIKNRFLRFGLASLIHGFAPVLRSAQLNRVVCINNWMLSTNLYPNWDGVGLGKLRDKLRERYPKHAILLRSLNKSNHAELLQRGADEGFLLAPSRQVYLINETERRSLRHQNCRWDRRLLEQSEHEIVTHENLEASDDARIKRLYDCLYLEKYTPLNPQFTERLIRRWRETKFLTLIGLRSPAGSLDGIVGCFRRGGVLTAPLVGYDTALPQSLGLYRMLMALTFRESFRGDEVLNLSSGAAHFKRLRGGQPWLEYTAVDCRHLPPYQRFVWRSLAGLLTHVGGRVLQRLEL